MSCLKITLLNLQTFRHLLEHKWSNIFMEWGGKQKPTRNMITTYVICAMNRKLINGFTGNLASSRFLSCNCLKWSWGLSQSNPEPLKIHLYVQIGLTEMKATMTWLFYEELWGPALAQALVGPTDHDVQLCAVILWLGIVKSALASAVLLGSILN